MPIPDRNGGPEVKITEVRGEWNGEPVRIEVDDYGDCTAHIGGAGRGIARVENIGLVNPFAIRLLMESLGIALELPPEKRMLRVDARPQWTPGGVPREEEGGGDA